jgi:hypothetical protein
MSDKEILEKLDTIIGLLAIQGKEKEEQIGILYSLGFNSIKISKLMGIPDSTIRKYKRSKHKKK